MRKLFLKISMLLFVLGMSVNAVWADMTPEQAVTYGYWSTVTVQPSTTTKGSGKIFVTTDNSTYPSIESVTDDKWKSQSVAEGYKEFFLEAAGVSDVDFYAYAKPDAGSYVLGWSHTDGGSDLYNIYQPDSKYASNKNLALTASNRRGKTNAKNYTVYVSFAPVQITSWTMVSGSQTTTKVEDVRSCVQNIRFRAETPGGRGLGGSVGDERHFKLPTITKKAGTQGTWAINVNGDNPWSNTNMSLYGDYAELNVRVTFTAPDDEAREYAATLTLETVSGAKMEALLYARTLGDNYEAIRYNKSKVQQETGNLTTLLANADDDDIIKLNGNYNNAVELNKDITFDLNGYTLSSTLTVSDGNVTLAYSPFGGAITGNVSVTGGKLTLTGGSITGKVNISADATLEQNGASITGTVTNAGTMTTTDGSITGQLASSGTLTLNGGTFTNNSGVAVNITAGTADFKRGTISGSTYGIQTTGGSATIGKLAAVTGSTKALYGNGGTLTVNNGKFTDPANLSDGAITFNAGYFQANNSGEATALGKQVWRNTAGVEFNEGYQFFVGDQEAATASNVSVCRINSTSYSSLEEALAYANNNPGTVVTIFMENDYTLPAGYYTIPANATLVVPRSNDQQSAYPVVEKMSIDETHDYSEYTPYPFRQLTLVNGVNLEILGTLELTGAQYSISGNAEQAIPAGPYGHLILKPGSHITLSSGAELRAWGYVSGDGSQDGAGNYLSGEIDARRGSIVREQFQMGDWKGGSDATRLLNFGPYAHLFPIYEYFIQNIESPVKYHPGSSLICATSVTVKGSISAFANNIKVVGKEGEPAMFLMNEMADAENTWVRKWYDVKKDQQVYEVNNSAQLGSLLVDLGDLPMTILLDGVPVSKISLNSAEFILPLTSNFKIHLLSGNMQFTQSTSCLPGMEVEVDKESEISIIKNSDPNVVSGGLYFYDSDQWGPFVQGNRYGAIVHYSATLNARPNVRDVSSAEAIGDAKLIVHGTFRLGENCAVYTTAELVTPIYKTASSDQMEQYKMLLTLNNMAVKENTGGASIISTNEDAGTFIFDADAPAFDAIMITGETPDKMHFGPNALFHYNPSAPIPMAGTAIYDVNVCSAARLKNGDGSFEETSNTTAGTTYCYRNDQWTTMQLAEHDCFMKEIVGGQTTYYAKPQEYVAVNATWDGEKMVGNADHTYSDKAGAGRLFILMDDCQWWEVEKKDNLYHCIHPDNDTYYYWDETEGKWMEKRFTITWKNYDGTEIKSYTYDPVTGDPEEVAYSVTYGTQAEYLGSNPTREPSEDYTYTFAGWSPELGPVKSDVTYTAVYTQQPRKYTVIFTEEGGKEIESHLLLLNEMPVCENTPARTGFTLQWEPEIQAVTGDATYRATWLENPPTEYAVTFYDYDGTTKLKPTGEEPYMVAVGAMPTPPAQVNGKPATSEYTYVFDHWSPALEKVSVTSAKSYTAVYREEARKYTISYYKEDGTTLITTEQLSYGAMPTPPDVTKENPETGHTYTLVWKTVDETGGIQTVMADASYKPTYLDVLNKYTVTVKSNPSGACSSTGAGLYDYNTSATITLVVNDGYTFTGWSDGLEGTNTSRTIIVTEDKELVANFTVANPDYTITWKKEDGSANLVAPVGQKSGTATIYSGPTPTKPSINQYSYTFYGWTTRDNDGNILNTYKNGMTPVASADATYFACFTSVVRQYNVSLSSTPAGVCMLVGAGSYDYSASNNATVFVSGYDAVNYTFDGWYDTNDDLVSDAESYSFAVQSDVELEAKFSPVTYTITWKSEDGVSTLETDDEQAYGAATAFNSAEPTKEAHSFIGWTTAANGEGSFYAKGATPAVSGDAIYYAYFTENAKNLVAEAGETPVTLGSPKDYANFVITSNGVSSGQLMDAQNLSLLGEAIFRLEQSFAAGQWYAVAVPWTVDPNTGIYAGSNHLSSGDQIYIIEFDANIYASADRESGRSDYWKFLDETGHDMQPGKLYMFYLKSAQSSLDFYKKAGASLCTTSTSVSTASGSEALQENWNAIANPALYYANMVTGAADDDVLKYNGNDAYVVASSTNMVVGQPIFAQVSTPSIVEATPVGGGAGMPAYRRAPQAGETNSRFEVELTHSGNLADRLIVQTADEKDNEYVIGQDLSKMGISAKVAQMWINRYDAKLCKNTVTLEGEQVEYPLNISAPVAGGYVLSATQERGEATLYLTYNGEAIWNLSESAYVANLNKGTDANYGLRISFKAPQTTTGMDEAIIDAQGEIKKVLIGNQVFIIRGDKVYTIDGQLVK